MTSMGSRSRSTGRNIQEMFRRGVVCARQSGSSVHVRRLVVCARFCCVILSLYLCNMILLLVFLNIITQLIKLCFSSHLCVGLLLLGLYSLPSPPSPPELLLSLSTSPKLSHTTHRTHPTQLLSSQKSHNSSHTTHLSQLILHNSTHSRAAFVCHLVELRWKNMNMNLINSTPPHR